MISARDQQTAQLMMDDLDGKDFHVFVVCEDFILPLIEERYGYDKRDEVWSAIHRGPRLTFVERQDLTIDTLNLDWADFVSAHYSMDDMSYIRSRITAGEIWGLFRGEEILGFIGLHAQGSMGMLEILPEHRRLGYAEYLLTFLTNKLLAEGVLPHDHIIVGNEASVRLQQKLGFEISERTLWWVGPSES
jgi:tRNA (guanine37-N1)-methyltransferase